jgi:hypothetical protein
MIVKKSPIALVQLSGLRNKVFKPITMSSFSSKVQAFLSVQIHHKTKWNGVPKNAIPMPFKTIFSYSIINLPLTPA